MSTFLDLFRPTRAVALAVLLTPPVLRAEPVLFVTQGMPGERAHILTVAQMGSEVHLTGTVEPVAEVWIGLPGPLYTVLELDVPALAVKQVDIIPAFDDAAFYTDRQLLFTQAQVLGSYEPALGSGWVHTALLGWVWLRQYPWIYDPEEGWLYTKGAELELESYPPRLAWWIYSVKDDEWTYRWR
ncbi:MAG: hypothetical protein ACLFR7_06680 [Opitutales bacterium]